MWLYRSFLVLVGLCFLSGAASAQTYDDPTIGFSVVKPPGWFFMDDAQMERSLQMTKVDNKALEDLIKKSAEKPLVALTKFREPYDDANPAVTIQVTPAAPYKGVAPVHVAKAMSMVISKMMKDARLKECSENTTFSGLPAAYCDFTGTFMTSDGDFSTRNRIWIVRRQEHFFIIMGSVRLDERNGTFAEVNAVIRSIKIDVRS